MGVGERGPPLPTAVNKWQLAGQAGQAAVTPSGAANGLLGCSGTTGQPACLWLERRWAGPQAASQGCRALFLGGPGQICRSIHGKPHAGCLIFNFSSLLGEGRLWERCGNDGWEDCAARDGNLENFSLALHPEWARAPGFREGRLDRSVHSRPDGRGRMQRAATGGRVVLTARLPIQA